MTTAAVVEYRSSKDAKAAGWFSRRHETSVARAEARQCFQMKRGDKIRNAHARSEAATKRTPREQLRRLDERLGVGVGAVNERARLKSGH